MAPPVGLGAMAATGIAHVPAIGVVRALLPGICRIQAHSKVMGDLEKASAMRTGHSKVVGDLERRRE